MDKIDFDILKLLEENGRISVKEISASIKLSAPAVSERIRRLEKSQVISGYRCVINPSAVGYNIRAIINVTLPVSKHKEFYAHVETEPTIINCYHVTGTYGMTLIVAVKDVKELETLLNGVQKFGDTNTQIILSNPISHKGYVGGLD